MSELKPCPFCGSDNLKHYVTQATGGRYRGVVVCNECGARKESYSDWTGSVTDAYYGDWKAANDFTREQARKRVESDWNRRESWFDKKKLISLANTLSSPELDTDCDECPLSRWCKTERYNGHRITCFECKTWHAADVIREAIGETR